MKRNILIAAILLLATATQAQVLVKNDREHIKLGEDKLEKILFTGENNGDGIVFILQSGETMTFDIDELHSYGFAADYTDIKAVKKSGKATIVYNEKTETIHIVNAKKGDLLVYSSEGKLAKSAKGTAISVADLPKGLYIVNYNKELNAKIVKK